MQQSGVLWKIRQAHAQYTCMSPELIWMHMVLSYCYRMTGAQHGYCSPDIAQGHSCMLTSVLAEVNTPQLLLCNTRLTLSM